MNIAFFSGILTLGLFFGGLYFLHAKQESGDRIFSYFVVGFWLMALERAIWGWYGTSWAEDHSVPLRIFVYAIRFAGYLVIAFGIIDKNIRSSSKQTIYGRASRLHDLSKSPSDECSSK